MNKSLEEIKCIKNSNEYFLECLILFQFQKKSFHLLFLIFKVFIIFCVSCFQHLKFISIILQIDTLLNSKFQTNVVVEIPTYLERLKRKSILNALVSDIDILYKLSNIRIHKLDFLMYSMLFFFTNTSNVQRSINQYTIAILCYNPFHIQFLALETHFFYLELHNSYKCVLSILNGFIVVDHNLFSHFDKDQVPCLLIVN